MHQTLQQDKFKDSDLKYDNSFLKPKSGIFGPKFKDFYFCTKLWNTTNSRISNMTIAFSNYSPKIPKVGILIPKFKDFYFAPTFATKQTRGR